MKHTAPNSVRERLHSLNRRYLALRCEIDTEIKMFRYPANLIEECTNIRNSIVEIQNSLTNPQRKAVMTQ